MLNCTTVNGKVNSKLHGDFVRNCSSLNLIGKFNDSVATRDQLSKRHHNAPALIDNEIHVLPTNQTPEFIFNYEGIIKIRGRGLYCDKPELSDQINNWIEGYLNNPAKITYVTIAFEYLNSSSTSVLVSILRKLSHSISQSKNLVVQWYYEVDDENILDRGKYISSYCKIPIEFIPTDNISSLLAKN
jgi:hypothetical protein